MTKLYELPNGRRFITDIDKSTNICNVTESQLDILIGDLNKYAEMCEHAIPIPEDATNGDMIMSMFPNLKIEYMDTDEYTNKPRYVKLIVGNTMITKISADRWNSPYKTESEDKE